MPGRCSCAGSTCGCSLVSGNATVVSGTGNAGDPYKVDVDPSQLNVSSTIQVSDSTSMHFTKTGTGSTVDPVIISGDVRLTAPDGSRWALLVANNGVLSATKI